MTPNIRKPLSRERLITVITGDSMVNAGFGNETDVNHIVERFTRTGYMPDTSEMAQYADVTELQRDFTDLIEESRAIQDKFNDYQEKQSAKKRELKENALNENEKLREQIAELQNQSETTPPD